MRRLLFILAIVLGCGLTGSLAARTGAQSGTPEAEPFPPGVTAEPLALGLAVLPEETDFGLFRWTLEPGTVFTESPLDSAVALVYVEVGSLTVDFASELTVTRGSAIDVLATPGVTMPPPEQVAAEATATLNAGDSVTIPLNAQGALRNDGTEPVVFLTALVTPRAAGAAAGTTPAA